jgi:hypothetical protein
MSLGGTEPWDSADTCVFINCPYDKDYTDRFFWRIVFTLLYCDVWPRCARENYGGGLREHYISELIKHCGLGFHDVSPIWRNLEASSNPNNGGAAHSSLPPTAAFLPRYNTPYELGRYIEIKNGIAPDLGRRQAYIVTSTASRLIHEYFSDLSGCAIQDYLGDPSRLILVTQSWINSVSLKKGKYCASPRDIEAAYEEWMAEFKAKTQLQSIPEHTGAYEDFRDQMYKWIQLRPRTTRT